MTVGYSDKLSKLLWRWRGSVWRSIWKQLLIWLTLWYAIHFVIIMALDEDQKLVASQVVESFNYFCDDLPLVFLLGFYVTQVMTRWWAQVMSIPWPDDLLGYASIILKDTENEQAKRESLARWLILSEAMAFRMISTKVYKRFPELEHLVDAGLATKEELQIIQSNQCEYVRWEMPLQWIIGKILAPTQFIPIQNVNLFRTGLKALFMYDWVTIPLVYTQTVTIVVYGYFAMALIGHQYEIKTFDLYFPWLSVLEFVFFVGWYNVAREMLYPFNENDDDIELNYLLDRHAAAAFSMAREVKLTEPAIITDEKQREEFGRKMLNNLTYSLAMTKFGDRPPKMKSVTQVKCSESGQVEQKEYERGRRLCGMHKCKKPRSYF